MSSRQRLARWYALSCLALCTAGAQAFEMRGFRGVMWGEGVDALGEAHAVYAAGQVTCYRREHENLIFGDSALNRVSYCFHNARLFLVAIDAAVGAGPFAAEFELMYGRPDARRGQLVSWGGKSSGTRADLSVLGAGARLALYSNKIEPAVAQRMQKLASLESPRRDADAL